MKNSEYWEKRVANNTWKTYNNLEEKNRALLEMYQEASLNISDELYRVAEKMKTSTPMLSDMHKFNRLTKLQENMNIIIKELGENVETFGKNNMYEGFNTNYKNVMHSLGQVEFAMPNEKLMEQLLNKPWFGSNFSTRLWKNTQVLATNLNDILTNGLIQGKTVTEMAIQLNNRMHEGFNVAHRLVRTETMHYLNESSIQAYKDSGCKKIQYWAASDERTCPRCGAKHGNPYNIKDAPVLPLHANCRCTYIPIIDGLDDSKNDIINDNIEFKNATDIKEAEMWAINNLKLKNISYKGIDIDVANYINKSMNDIYNEYPLLNGFVQEIKTDGRASAPASASISFKDGKLNTKLTLSKKDLSDLKSIDEMIKQCLALKWWTPKNGIEGIIKHEMGHMIEYALTLKKYGVINTNAQLVNLNQIKNAFDAINKGEISKEIKIHSLSKLKLINAKQTIKNNLSEYSYKSTLEFLAEAVSEHDPRPLAKEVVRLLKEKIKEVWK